MPPWRLTRYGDGRQYVEGTAQVLVTAQIAVEFARSRTAGRPSWTVTDSPDRVLLD
jgi:hypothetical protein